MIYNKQLTKRFEQTGDFNALQAAQDWCRENGYSYGSQQRGSPTGLMRGDFMIAKWRNLTRRERMELDGTITASDFRNGPVTVEIFDK